MDGVVGKVQQNPQRRVCSDVRTIGQSSCAQRVSSGSRCPFQYRSPEASRSDTNRSDNCNNQSCRGHSSNEKVCLSNISSTNSCISHKSFESSSKFRNWPSCDAVKNRKVLGTSHQYEVTVEHSDTSHRVLSDMTNRDRQRIESEIPNRSSEWNKDKENQPDRQKCDQPSSGMMVGEKNGQCRLEDIMGPLNVRRLRPIRQKTRNVVLSILEDETVCLEFIKSKGSDIYVTEVLRISSDGNKITSYTTNCREGVVLQEKPPPVPRTAVSYAFSGLPRKLWKKYQYADKFIRLVRMKSPKVSFLHSILPELCFCVSGSVRVMESFGKLCKLKMPFSWAWKALEKRGFSKWLWKSLGFLYGKSLKIS